VLHLPCYILSGLLALMLVIREQQHSRIHKGLIDKILESRGMEKLPDEHPLVDAITKLAGDSKEPLTPEQKRLMATAKERVRFNIPNMPQMPKPGSNY
jgi:hypothetical protein